MTEKQQYRNLIEKLEKKYLEDGRFIKDNLSPIMKEISILGDIVIKKYGNLDILFTD